MLHHSRKLTVAALLSGAVFLAACGGSPVASGGSTGGGSTGGPAAGGSSPTVVSVGDAPMSSVLSAVVTISAITATNAGGPVPLLSQPATIELTHLGGIRAPLSLPALPFGTYSAVSLTVTAARISYIDSNGNVQTANATIPAASATTTVNLNPTFTVGDTGATDLRFDFDLQDSLDLTNGAVTFTPAIAALAARVKDETPAAAEVHTDGTVTAVSATANTITMTTLSGMTVTLNVNASTTYDDGLSLTNLAPGTAIHAVATINPDGSLTALTIADVDGSGGATNGEVDNGIVTSITNDSQGQLQQFTLVVRQSTNKANVGQSVTVQVNNATVIKASQESIVAGVTTFDSSMIFAGQAVWMAGTDVAAQTTPTVLATEIRPAQVNPFGLSQTAVQVASGVDTFALLLDNATNFAKFAQLTSVTVSTNSATVYSGAVTGANLANLQIGSPMVARGFLTENGSTATIFCTHLREEAQAPKF